MGYCVVYLGTGLTTTFIRISEISLTLSFYQHLDALEVGADASVVMSCRKKLKAWWTMPIVVWVNRLLALLLLFLTICLVVLLTEPLFKNGWVIRLSSDGIKSMIDYWDDYVQLITLFCTSLTLYVASVQLKKHLDVEAINALSDLRTKLNSKEKKVIHNYLLPIDDKKIILAHIQDDKENKIDFSNLELFDYIGTIELGAIMLKRKIITMDEFYNQFGYRVENLINNVDVLKHVYGNKTYYKAFLDIVEELNDYIKTHKNDK